MESHAALVSGPAVTGCICAYFLCAADNHQSSRSQSTSSSPSQKAPASEKRSGLSLIETVPVNVRLELYDQPSCVGCADAHKSCASHHRAHRAASSTVTVPATFARIVSVQPSSSTAVRLRQPSCEKTPRHRQVPSNTHSPMCSHPPLVVPVMYLHPNERDL